MLRGMSTAPGDASIMTGSCPQASSAALVPPHPVIDGYYRDAAGKRPFLRDIFDATAGDYDKVERVLALGTGPWHRRRELRFAGLGQGMRVLDVAMGTGLVAREAASIVGDPALVLGVDPSIGMLGEARRSLGVAAVLGVGEALPVANAAFDFVSMGYALRHLPDLGAAFREFARALKPGGRVCVLEISRPRGAIGRAALATYFRGVLPMLSRVIGTSAQTRELWRYYWQTIDACVEPEVVMASLRDAGFSGVTRRVQFGIFSTFAGTRA
jgi:demethylmenaquinone methyltransferase / 2-methoxy-6-polyprenyl-1,4-benzoquinol methylase